MRIRKKVLAGILIMALCTNMGLAEGSIAKGMAEKSQNTILMQQSEKKTEKDTSKETKMTDSQGLVYEPYRDDEGEVTDENLLQVSAGKLKMGKIVVPETFQGKKVMAVAWRGFYGCKKLTSITLGSNIELISSNAFANCVNLSEVKIDKAATTYIGEAAFEKCTSLKRIKLPKKLAGLSFSVFASSGLEEIIIPNSVRNIWDYVFQDCKQLKKVTLGKKLRGIGHNCFEGCTALKEIVIPKKTEYLREEAFLGCENLNKVIFKGKLEEIGKDAFAKTPFKEKEKDGEYCIVNGLMIETYGEIKGNLLINGKKKINGKKVRGISGTAYANNKKIKKLTIKNIERITGHAFENCKADICEVQNIKEMSYYAFYGGKIDKIKVKKIKKLDECFVEAAVKEFYASDIGKCGYEGIPRNVRKIVMDGIKKKGEIPNLRVQKKLKEAIIRGNISEIPSERLEFCTSLKTLTIETPLELQWTHRPWDYEWFTGCEKLKDVYIKAGKVNGTISGVFSKDITLHVPEEQIEIYKEYVDCKVVAW